MAHLGSADSTGEPPWNQRMRGWFRRHWLLDTAWKLTVFTVGFSLLFLGVFLLVFPGPGWATIALGLIVLASEYVWAQRLLQPLRTRLSAVKAKAQDPRNRVHMRIITLVGIAVVGTLVTAYVMQYGITMEGVRQLWPL